MALIDRTALILGDPAARQARHPTAEERERTGRRYDTIPAAKVTRGLPTSELGKQVRAMQVGDKIETSVGKATNYASYMSRTFGWQMSTRSRKNADGTTTAILHRVR